MFTAQSDPEATSRFEKAFVGAMDYVGGWLHIEYAKGNVTSRTRALSSATNRTFGVRIPWPNAIPCASKRLASSVH